MADQSSGNNLIPGLNMRNIYQRDLDLLKGFGKQVGSTYDQYGKTLRSALGQDQDKWSQQFLAGKLLEQREGKDYIVNGVTYDGKTHRPKGAPESGYSLSPDGKMIAHTAVKEPVITENPAPVPTAETGAARLDPNATKDYKAAFGAGQKKMDDMLEYFGSQENGENLKTWAKANPALAWKEYKKAGMAGKEPFGYNEVVYGKLESNPAKNIKELGIDKLYDGQADDTRTAQEKFAQAFLGDAIKGLTFGKYGNLGSNPYQIDPGTLLEKSVDFNIPGLERPLGNYGLDDYANLLKDSHIIYN